MKNGQMLRIALISAGAWTQILQGPLKLLNLLSRELVAMLLLAPMVAVPCSTGAFLEASNFNDKSCDNFTAFLSKEPIQHASMYACAALVCPGR